MCFFFFVCRWRLKKNKYSVIHAFNSRFLPVRFMRRENNPCNCVNAHEIRRSWERTCVTGDRCRRRLTTRVERGHLFQLFIFLFSLWEGSSVCAPELDRNKSFSLAGQGVFSSRVKARPPRKRETFSAYPYTEWLFHRDKISRVPMNLLEKDLIVGFFSGNLRMTWRVFIFCKRIRGRHGCWDLLTTVSNIFNDPQMTKELSSILFFCNIKGKNLNKSISYFSIELEP